jgi:hypothetical protein
MGNVMTKLIQGAAALGIPLSLLAAGGAHAELKVRMPTVDYREVELEHNGLVTFGRKGTECDGAQNYTNEIAYGLTPWWQIELEQALVANPGTTLRNEAFALRTYSSSPNPVNISSISGSSQSTSTS